MRWRTRLSDEVGERWPGRERRLYIGLYGWCTCGLEMGIYMSEGILSEDIVGSGEV